MNQSSAENEDSSVHVDLLKVCGVEWNLSHILEHVFEYLSAKDLTAVHCVNKTWSSVVRQTKHANGRREKYLNDIRKLKETLGEENWPVKRPPLEARLLEPRLAFSDIKNTKKKVFQQAETPSIQNVHQLVGSQSAAVISSTTNTSVVHRRTQRYKRAIFTPIRGRCDDVNNSVQVKPIDNTSTYMFLEETRPVKEVLLGSKKSKRNLKRL